MVCFLYHLTHLFAIERSLYKRFVAKLEYSYTYRKRQIEKPRQMPPVLTILFYSSSLCIYNTVLKAYSYRHVLINEFYISKFTDHECDELFIWLALFSIQQTDLTSFSQDRRGVKWLCINLLTNPNPNSNPNRINKKIQKKKRLYKIDRAVCWMEKSANLFILTRESTGST